MITIDKIKIKWFDPAERRAHAARRGEPVHSFPNAHMCEAGIVIRSGRYLSELLKDDADARKRVEMEAKLYLVRKCLYAGIIDRLDRLHTLEYFVRRHALHQGESEVYLSPLKEIIDIALGVTIGDSK